MAERLVGRTNIKVRNGIHFMHAKSNTPMKIHQELIAVHGEDVISTLDRADPTMMVPSYMGGCATGSHTHSRH